MNKRKYIKWFEDNNWPETAEHIRRNNIKLLNNWLRNGQPGNYSDMLNRFLRSHKLSLYDR
jgi:hypothetical protein